LSNSSEIGAAEIVNRVLSEGLFINRDALDLLRKSTTKEVYEKTISKAIMMTREEKVSTVEVKHILAAISISRGEAAEPAQVSRVPLGKEMDSEVEIIYNPPDRMPVSDSVESRTEYFQSRLNKLERILRSRPDYCSPVPIGEISRNLSQAPFKAIVIITKKEWRRLVVEDLSGSATVTLPRKSDPELEEKFACLIEDMVVGLELRCFQDTILIDDIVLPDVPDTPIRKTRDPIVTVLLSDLHVGSTYFQEKEFTLLTEWMSGNRGTAFSREIANAVKYVVIAGDIVDGVFVYPKQENELKIVNLEEQYGEAQKALLKIPDHIHVVIGPGNHDVVRDAIPQPPIPRDLMRELVTDRGNVTMVGNPAQTLLHGIRFLVYHGQSLEDIAASVPSIEYSKPHEGMRFLLRARHLAPVYGGNTQICAEGEDDLAISTKPDVFHAGHVHVAGICSYRGTQIVNSGTWQGQTPFQSNLGIQPTTAKLGVHLMKEGRSTLLSLTDLI